MRAKDLARAIESMDEDMLNTKNTIVSLGLAFYTWNI